MTRETDRYSERAIWNETEKHREIDGAGKE